MSENETPVTVSAPTAETLPVEVAALDVSDSLPPDEHGPDERDLDIAEAQAAKAPAAAKEMPTDKEGKPIPSDNPKNYKPTEFPRGANPNVLPVSPIFKPVVVEEDRDTPFHLAALPCDSETFNSLVDSYPSINYGHGLATREWAAEIDLAGPTLLQANFLSKATSRTGSKWAQRAPHGASTLGPTRPQLDRNGGPGTKLSGDQATARIMQQLNTGAPISVPLWHSGFWMSLRAPTLAARLELQRRMDSEKITLGRVTNGLAFSNMSVYTKGYLVDFALAHVSQANVRYKEAIELKDIILSTDIPALIWASLATMYPSGYPYHQPCVNDPSTCQHIVKQILDINKIYFIDTQLLTEAQLTHMARRDVRHEIKDLQIYRDAHRYAAAGKIEIKSRSSKIGASLAVPTITEYLSAGYAWVDGITSDIQRAFGQDLQGEKRNQYILERAQVTNMCEYGHWVKQLVLSDGSEVDDVESIRSSLLSISGEPEMSGTFFKQIGEYMEDATIGMVALPRYDCPNCGKAADEEEMKHPYLNPIDIETLFFTTGAQHIAKAAP